MCGILWAFYNRNIHNNDVDNFHVQLQKIFSRWPDYTWFYQDWSLLFGHTRLSIIDTSDAANQPFQRGDFTVIFNGEIYNFHELKKELQDTWYSFSTTSDTEVLVYAYQERWEKCVERFDGMWAFALYDKKHHKVFMSRDRILGARVVDLSADFRLRDRDVYESWYQVTHTRSALLPEAV